LGRRDCRESFVLGLLARLATLGLVFQAFVVEEHLFAGGPDEVFVTVDASDWPILIFAMWSRFQRVSRFRSCHVLLPGSFAYNTCSGGRIKNNVLEKGRSSVVHQLR
jgi:hypothetical protein